MDKQGSFWFLAGLGCGAVVGMLYAPLPGARTRAIAAAKAKQAQRLFERRGGETAGNATQVSGQAASAAREAGQRISRALDATRRSLPQT